VERVKIGQVVRALRRAQNLRQTDVARCAGLAQQTISDVECGRFGYLSIEAYCRLVEALGATVELMPRWRGPRLARLLDRRHASLCDAVARYLESLGWEIRAEFTFNHFGDRGSVDLLAWRPDLRALLIVEIKSEFVSIEETLRTLDMKARVVPMVAARDLGWAAERLARGPLVGVVLVLPERSTERDLAARHTSLLSGSLPARNVEVRRWLRLPVAGMRGILFFRDTGRPGAVEVPTPGRRVRAAPAPRVAPRREREQGDAVPIRAQSGRSARLEGLRSRAEGPRRGG
jgi:transcriptional regulator with XRE-family HTH domain